MDKLRAAMTLVELDDDALVYAFAEEPDAVYFIFEGEVKTLNQSSDGQMVLFGLRSSGDYVGQSGVITGAPRAFEVRAKGKTVLGRLEGDVFVDLFTSEQVLAKDLLFRLAAVVQERLLISAGQNVLPSIGLVAFDILRRSGKDKNEIDLPPRNEWAAYLGLTRETLSRTLSQLKEEGVIVFDKTSLTIQNKEKLSDISAL